ncbi:MAG TPA: WYL domain-containing protein [Myxococcaceae bacterium]|nr:WYL domain-containing protein [Myxococcaceae bacterium]
MSDVRERLRRLLFLVPYASRRPGISVRELADALGIGEEELLKELDLLTMVGRPPFQPDDYIDVYVENGRVYVDLDQRFSAPPRLTAAEAAALRAAADLVRATASSSLRSAMDKLERVLPPEARDQYRDMGKTVDASIDGPAELAPLAEAISRSREVTFEYFSRGRGATEARTVRPLELFSHRGQWYLYAYCCSRNDERLFRLDRVRKLAVTDRTFGPPPASRGKVPEPVSGRGEIRVRFSAAAAPYMQERFGEAARPVGNGSVEVSVSSDSERWLTQWVLSFGGEAEVIEPNWAREAVARAAAAIAS